MSKPKDKQRNVGKSKENKLHKLINKFYHFSVTKNNFQLINNQFN